MFGDFLEFINPATWDLRSAVFIAGVATVLGNLVRALAETKFVAPSLSRFRRKSPVKPAASEVEASPSGDPASTDNSTANRPGLRDKVKLVGYGLSIAGGGWAAWAAYEAASTGISGP